MTGGSLRRRLVLCFLGISSLLGIYILCISLEIRVPWRMADLARFPGTGDAQGTSRSPVSEDPVDISSERRTTRPPSLTFNPKLLFPGATPGNSSGPPPGKGDTAGPSTQAGATDPGRDPGPPPLPAKPTEPLFIGDSYYSEDDSPTQIDCPDSIRRRVPETGFGERFLDRIPVLQWAKHATPDQYQRLVQYPGAHGWGGIDFHTLESALSVLDTSANRHMFDDWDRRSNGSHCIRCAVVGNGGILKNSKKGQEINRHDYVFRTNGAVIKGFEVDVGSRTSLYTFSTNTMRNSMRSYAGVGYRGPPQSEETRYVFLPDHDRDYLLMQAAATHTPVERGPEANKKPPTYFGENVTAEKFKMYHPDFIRYLRNRFLRSHALKTKYKDIYRPSTGAVMLLAAVHTCDQVSAYGFMTPDYANYSDHYYDSSFHKVGFFINHDLRMEMALWQDLHHAGLITLYMRQ